MNVTIKCLNSRHGTGSAGLQPDGFSSKTQTKIRAVDLKLYRLSKKSSSSNNL